MLSQLSANFSTLRILFAICVLKYVYGGMDMQNCIQVYMKEDTQLLWAVHVSETDSDGWLGAGIVLRTIKDVSLLAKIN